MGMAGMLCTSTQRGMQSLGKSSAGLFTMGFWNSSCPNTNVIISLVSPSGVQTHRLFQAGLGRAVSSLTAGEVSA